MGRPRDPCLPGSVARQDDTKRLADEIRQRDDVDLRCG